MTTFSKRVLAWLPRLGLRATPLGGGSALVSRHDRDRVTPLGKNVWLVARGENSRATEDAVLASRGKTPGHRRLDLAPGASLLTDPRTVRSNTHAVQKAFADHLGAEHVNALLETYGVNCVLDVGAHAGQFAKRLRSGGYTGRIVSFEPVPSVAERLRQAAADDPDWWVYPCALGSAEGEAEMTVVSGTMSSLRGPSEFGTGRYKRFRKATTEQVPVRRLDGLLPELIDGLDDPRPYLKLDTQGFDLEVFRGAGDSIKDFVGMQSEVALLQIYADMPRMPEALATYEAAGFEVTGMFPVTREEHTGRVLEFDCILFRASALPDPTA